MGRERREGECGGKGGGSMKIVPSASSLSFSGAKRRGKESGGVDM